MLLRHQLTHSLTNEVWWLHIGILKYCACKGILRNSTHIHERSFHKARGGGRVMFITLAACVRQCRSNHWEINAAALVRALQHLSKGIQDLLQWKRSLMQASHMPSVLHRSVEYTPVYCMTIAWSSIVSVARVP